MSVKVISECERCGYPEDFTKDTPRLTIPERWQHFGICPKHLLCPSCSATLSQKIRDLTYIFVSNKDKTVLMQMVDK